MPLGKLNPLETDEDVDEPASMAPVIHGKDRKEAKKQMICINVSGIRFNVMKFTLRRLPHTILGNIIMKEKSWVHDEFYDPINNEYFFDRNPLIFAYVLNFYRTGELHIPHDKCGSSIKRELDFWGINEGDIQACCWLNYSKFKNHRNILHDFELEMNEIQYKVKSSNKDKDSRKSKRTLDDSDTELKIDDVVTASLNYDIDLKELASKVHQINSRSNNNLKDEKEHSTSVDVKEKGNLTKVRCWLNRTIENSWSTPASIVYSVLFLLLVATSISAYVLSTHKYYMKAHYNQTVSGGWMTYIRDVDSINSCKYDSSCQLYISRTLIEMDFWIQILFTLELVLRIIICKSLKKFFSNFFNWNDILSLLPFYVELGMIIHMEQEIISYSYLLEQLCKYPSVITWMNLFRILRVTRILKLLKHFSDIKVLYYTVKSSIKELFLINILIAILTLFFGSIMYFAEDKKNYPSLPESLWWALITATTVGYGDFVPKTFFGYVVGSVCAITGMLVVAFTVPVGVSNFTLFYGYAQSRLQHKKRMKKQKENLKKMVAQKNRKRKIRVANLFGAFKSKKSLRN
ncbi:hypothetical protein SNEBB_006736 [Seison nebaliae]|nr:hypothetical protein SNEBB_006736 [Seison nebaliae]